MVKKVLAINITTNAEKIPIGNPKSSISIPTIGIRKIPKIDTIEGINEYTAFRFSEGTRSKVILWFKINIISPKVGIKIQKTIVKMHPSNKKSFSTGKKYVRAINAGKKRSE